MMATRLAAILLASSFVSNFAVARSPGLVSIERNHKFRREFVVRGCGRFCRGEDILWLVSRRWRLQPS